MTDEHDYDFIKIRANKQVSAAIEAEKLGKLHYFEAFEWIMWPFDNTPMVFKVLLEEDYISSLSSSDDTMSVVALVSIDTDLNIPVFGEVLWDITLLNNYKLMVLKI